MEAGNPPAALRYFDRVIDEAQGDPDGALAMYELALNTDPADFPSLFNSALIFIDAKGDHPAALGALREALRINPDLDRAHIYLGRSLVLLADPSTYPEAESALLRGLELQPPQSLLPMAHLTLAELYRRTGRSAEAQHHQTLGERAQRQGGS